jgi:hypothetical protein
MDKREEMLLLMEEFGNSGLSQKEFSTAKGMPFHRFNYWYRKLKKENGEPAGFVRVDTRKPDVFPVGQFELEYPNGVRLKIPACDLSLLSHLIALY